MLSWQTLLLPYLNLKPLYERINQEEPWTSPTNQIVYSEPIPLCSHPGAKPAGAFSAYAGNSHVFQINRALNLREFTDGTSNTILIGEVSAGFKLWGDPTNIRDPAFGLGKTPEQFGGTFPNVTLFLMADGAVRKVKSDVDPTVLKALATPNGGEKLDDFWDK